MRPATALCADMRWKEDVSMIKVEQAVLFASQLLLCGWADQPLSSDFAVQIGHARPISPGPSCLSFAWIDAEPNLSKGSRNGGAAQRQYIVAMGIDAFGTMAGRLLTESIVVICNGVTVNKGALTVTCIGSGEAINTDAVRIAKAAVDIGLVPSLFSIIFRNGTRWRKPGIASGAVLSIDRAEQGANGICIEGWASHTGSPTMAIASHEFAFACTHDDMARKPRADTLGHVQGLGFSNIQSAMTGFMLTMPVGAGAGGIYLIEAADDLNLVVGPFVLPEPGDGNPLKVLHDAAEGPGNVPASRLERSVRLLVAPQTRRSTSFASLQVLVPQPTKTSRPGLTVLIEVPDGHLPIMSLLAQLPSWPRNIEIIAICRHDDTQRKIKLRVELSDGGSPMLSSFVAPRDSSRSTFMNHAAKEALGEFLLILPSPLWFEDFSDVNVAIARVERGEAALIGLDALTSEAADWPAAVRLDGDSSRDDQRLSLRRDHADTLAGEPFSICEAVADCPIVIARAEFKAVGGFDERFRGGSAMDADLCRRMRNAGRVVMRMRSGSCVRLPEIQGAHRPSFLTWAHDLLDIALLHGGMSEDAASRIATMDGTAAS
jgi:hypothetical protein